MAWAELVWNFNAPQSLLMRWPPIYSENYPLQGNLTFQGTINVDRNAFEITFCEWGKVLSQDIPAFQKNKLYSARHFLSQLINMEV